MANSFLSRLINNSEDISEEAYFGFMHKILNNELGSSEVIAFITALSAKRLNRCDIVPFVRFIHNVSPLKKINKSNEAINIVGTGGGLPTFNISTTAAFVASAAGATVLKNGSHSYTSKCGSIDVLRKLGLNINLTQENFEKMVNEIELGFVGPDFYAPLLKRIAIMIQPLTIKEIGGYINTIGPLLCPFKVKKQLTGVNSMAMVELMAQAMSELKFNDSIVCWAEIGMDELSSIGNNYILKVGDKNGITVVSSDKLGFQYCNPGNLKGGDTNCNAELIMQILTGKIRDEKRETVALNSAYVLLLSEKVNDISDGIELSFETIDNGKAYKKLKNTIEFSRDNARR